MPYLSVLAVNGVPSKEVLYPGRITSQKALKGNSSKSKGSVLLILGRSSAGKQLMRKSGRISTESWMCLSMLWEGFPRGSAVQNLPAMQEMQVGSLGQEDPLEEGMAIHYNTLAWRIPRTKEPGGLQSTGLQRVRHNWSYLACTHVCYENPLSENSHSWKQLN